MMWNFGALDFGRCTVVSLLNRSGDMWLPAHREDSERG